MAELKNLEKHPEAGVLSLEEIDVLVEVLKIALQHGMGDDLAGTLIIDAQKLDGEAQRILRCNLPAGEYTVMDAYKTNDKEYQGIALSGNKLAEDAIKGVLEWPKHPWHRCLSGYAESWDIPTGFYSDERQTVMVMRTSCGRFLMALNLASEWHIRQCNPEFDVRLAMGAVLMALAQMAPGDSVIQKSLKEVNVSDFNCYAPMGDELWYFCERDVQHLFRGKGSGVNSVIVAWKKWRDKTYGKGFVRGPRVYFR